jgi:hypothetical protein
MLLIGRQDYFVSLPSQAKHIEKELLEDNIQQPTEKDKLKA